MFVPFMYVNIKQVSIIKKYHNHTLQTNPWHREEEPHVTITRHQEDKPQEVEVRPLYHFQTLKSKIS